jgi:Mn-dependent DtxR family transcriptional regulator
MDGRFEMALGVFIVHISAFDWATSEEMAGAMAHIGTREALCALRAMNLNKV